MSIQVARDWEARFTNWKGKASESEQDRYERTCRAIDQALRSGNALDDYTFKVYPKGSYPNFTNVVADSDVDIAVELTTFFQNRFIHKAEGLSLADVGITPYTGDATLEGFKDDVERALKAHFGDGAVDRGSKAIRIAESTGRLPADVVPCVTERTWTDVGQFHEGIRLQNDRDRNERIVNYPAQHLAEGKRKNTATSKRYKRVVRILKRLENQMVAEGVIKAVPSFLIESLVWNTPDSKFEASTWSGRVQNALAHAYNETRSAECFRSNNWLEANAQKFLFYDGQNWSYQEAHAFVAAAWQYVGYPD
jgi:hypothetical protein